MQLRGVDPRFGRRIRNLEGMAGLPRGGAIRGCPQHGMVTQCCESKRLIALDAAIEHAQCRAVTGVASRELVSCECLPG